MKQISFWYRRFYRRALQLFGSRFYFNPKADPCRSILVAGTARSGTTWLGDLIAAQLPSRILFEPFHRDLVSGYRKFHYFQYMRPGTDDPAFLAFAQKIFTGEIRNRWIDHQNQRIFSQVRLVKEIRANLALKWLHDNFPQVPILLMIRHPCAVVLSRMELGWATDSDIEPFLLQPQLIEDHLGPYLDLIHNATNIEEKHAVIWSVCNLVPLRQCDPGDLKIVSYEKLCTQLEAELARVLGTIGYKPMDPLRSIADHPSPTARSVSAVVTGTDKIEGWKKKLSHSQIDNILRVVHGFGLSHLYGDSSLPLAEGIS